MWPDGARWPPRSPSISTPRRSGSARIPRTPAPGRAVQGTYGAKVAVPQILDLLARHGVQATFYIPGRVAERHPERVRGHRRGHEIAHHGYTQPRRTGSTRAEEETEVVRGLEILRGFGAEVTGYRRRPGT